MTTPVLPGRFSSDARSDLARVNGACGEVNPQHARSPWPNAFRTRMPRPRELERPGRSFSPLTALVRLRIWPDIRRRALAANETPSALIDPSRPGKALVAAGLLFVLAACGSTPAGTKPTSKGPRYTVGGTATGIRGEVVLLKNQADRLSVNQDGPFVFAEPLAQGAAFEVTIVSTPRRTACVVENGDGVVGDSDVLSVVLRCRSWQHGPPISLAGMRPPKRGQVAAALADNGDAVVAWHAMVRTRYRLSRGVFVAERRDGEWRQAARMLPGESPRLGVDASGHTILSSFDPENDVIYHMTYRSNRWLGPERIRDEIGRAHV